MQNRLILRHLCFTGPDKVPALLTFERGLNVLYGASDTGKSFVLEAIDFMLGGSKPLRGIKERVGYDQVFLGIEVTNGSLFTLYRSSNGGDFYFFEGLHQSFPEDKEATTLLQKHAKGKSNSVSNFLLSELKLTNKKIRKNQEKTEQFTFRTLAKFCIVGEGDIQAQRSPIERGQVIDKTKEYSAFKLLLSGIDDSSFVASKQNSVMSQSREAKIEILDEVLLSLRNKLASDDSELEKLEESLDKLEATISQEKQSLAITESHYQEVTRRRNELRYKFQSGIERQGEIQDLLARFSLLEQHYQSDITRLIGIQEAGSLVAALQPETCPLCGAEPKDQHQEKDCDGNVNAVVSASEAEIRKISLLRQELKDTITKLYQEAESFAGLMPAIEEELGKVEKAIKKLQPELAQHRTGYSDLIDIKSTINDQLAIWNQVLELQSRRSFLTETPDLQDESQSITDLSTSLLDMFAQHVEKILKAWKLPNSERVQFDSSTRDLVINGSPRTSHGKGMRSITHAAFTIGLLEYCRDKDLPHPGFVILDSPLLAYRQPEGDADDLRDTDVQEKFYEYLAGWNDSQVLIIENVTPPEFIQKLSLSQFFTANLNQCRSGFFPT
jgi:hypothetical protein